MTALAIAPLAAAAAIAAVWLALQTGALRQRRRLVGTAVDPEVGSATLLFFTGAACTVCHTAQRPVLAKLRPRLGDRVTLREVDIAGEPDLASRYGIMTLPTTVIVDQGGRVAAVNAGFASGRQLEEQLTAAGLLDSPTATPASL